MTTYKEILSQIEALQRQAEDARVNETAHALSQIVTIQALRGRQNRISVEGAAQHFQHAMSLLAQRVQA